jgi:hypothetical protein
MATLGPQQAAADLAVTILPRIAQHVFFRDFRCTYDLTPYGSMIDGREKEILSALAREVEQLSKQAETIRVVSTDALRAFPKYNRGMGRVLLAVCPFGAQDIVVQAQPDADSVAFSITGTDNGFLKLQFK